MLKAFYDAHSYPPPVDDLDAYKRIWNDDRRQSESCLLWPDQPHRNGRSILVAGCGTVQAARYAVRWPNARVVGIDVSTQSLAFSEELKRSHGLNNLELRELPLERAHELRETFDHIACTGVLHHLPDPDSALRALREALAPHGSMQIMVYAPYGRAGIYMIQEYCRRLNISWTREQIRALASTLSALPPDHPLAPLLRNAPDFRTEAGLADALLHPCDRPYSVPQLVTFIQRNGLSFGRWVRQAPYLPQCGAFASTPHGAVVAALPIDEQYAAMELFRGTMVRHSAIAFADEAPRVDFSGDAWRAYVPVRLPDTVMIRENAPADAAAVLINRNHTYTDLYLPIDTSSEELLNAVDGRRTIEEISGEGGLGRARAFFELLWNWDQVVFNTSGSKQPIQ